MATRRRSSLSSPIFEYGSATSPNIRWGGASSSNTLNRYFAALLNDMTLLAGRTASLAARSDDIVSLSDAQGAALSGMYVNLSNRIDAIASGNSFVLADFHSPLYIQSNTGSHSQLYGQITLPTNSATELLTVTDVYGRKWAPDDVVVSYAITADATEPAESAYLPNEDARLMLTEDESWLLPSIPAGSYVWVRVDSPLQYEGMAPNALDFHVLPTFGFDLMEVAFRGSSSPSAGGWTGVDLNYLTGWNGSYVSSCGPVRVHLPSVTSRAYRVCLRSRVSTAWGVQKLSVKSIEYGSSSVLTLANPYGKNVSSATVVGKDVDTLGNLSIIISGSTVEVDLLATDTGATPVLTGVLMRVL